MSRRVERDGARRAAPADDDGALAAHVPTGLADRSLEADFVELFRNDYPRLLRGLTAYCSDADVAAEAVQEAFYKALKHWHRVRRLEDPAGWIRRVAINQLHDTYRRRSRDRSLVERLAAQHDELVEDPHLDDAIGDALGLLPTQQRTAIYLFYMRGASVREVASTMGISEGAVKFHLHSGRRTLRSRADETLARR